MRALKSRIDDSTFELNLAPMLDIIVSIIPMLLLSVVFTRITVIDTPVPQAVEQAVAENTKHVGILIPWISALLACISIVSAGLFC